MTDRLGDARRANGARIESQRRAADNTAARRAIGERIESERRGAAVQDDINSLVRPVAARKQLRSVPPLGPLPAKRGRADYKAPPAASTGGGIASPLTEKTIVADGKTVPDRAHYEDMVLLSSDGLFTYIAKPIKTLNFLDADTLPVVIQLAAPPPVAP